MGRPRKEIDADSVRKLASHWLTVEDIGDFFGCSARTISDRFPEELKLGRVERKKNIRALMWKRAKEGSIPALLRFEDRCFGPLNMVNNGDLPEPIVTDEDGNHLEA